MTQSTAIATAEDALKALEASKPRHATFAAALAAFQAEVPMMSKDETAKVTGQNAKTGEKVSYKYGYAGLDQFVEIVEPVLGKHGLAITSRTTFDQHGSFMLEVSLIHDGSDHRETAYWPLPDPRRFGPQDIGSSLTYGKRYLGWGLTGTFPGGIDDDGAKAQQSARDSWDDARPARPAQQARPVSADPAPAEPVFTDEKVAEYQKKIATEPNLDLAVKGYDWLASKDQHNRDVPSPDETDVRLTATEVLAVRLGEEALDAAATIDDIKRLQTIATDRGLLKIEVSATETLADVLYTAQELAKHAVEQGTQERLNDEQGD